MSSTISKAQARRFWAIAKNEGEYSRTATYRLLKRYGYKEAEQIEKSEYDAIIEDARDRALGAKLRAPRTLDLFDQSNDSP